MLVRYAAGGARLPTSVNPGATPAGIADDCPRGHDHSAGDRKRGQGCSVSILAKFGARSVARWCPRGYMLRDDNEQAATIPTASPPVSSSNDAGPPCENGETFSSSPSSSPSASAARSPAPATATTTTRSTA